MPSTPQTDTSPATERLQIELMRQWAAQLGVLDLLERALAE